MPKNAPIMPLAAVEPTDIAVLGSPRALGWRQFHFALSGAIRARIWSRAGAWLLCSRGQAISVFVLLTIQAGLLAYSATRHSPTHLEPAFLAAGVSHWQLGRFELYRVNPPLPRMIAALPVVAAGCETDWRHFYEGPGARSEFTVGKDFIKVNGIRSIRLMTYARWCCIPIACLGAFCAYLWANDLYGSGAGLLAMTLWVFEPNILAHCELITPDSACTAFGIAAAYGFFLWLKQPTFGRATLAAVLLSLAQLSRMTWIILFALWPLIWCIKSAIYKLDESHLRFTRLKRELLQLAFILAAAVYGVNFGYAFNGSFSKLKEFDFVSQHMTGSESPGQPGNRFRGTWLGAVPVPLPKQYVLGIDAQTRDFEDFAPQSYLCGTWSSHGSYCYYLCCMLFKTPCAYLALGAAVTFLRLRSVRFVPDVQFLGELVLLLPAITIFATASLQTEINHHFRYVLPSIGAFLIFAAQAKTFCTRGLFYSVLVFGLMAHSIVGTILAVPHQLAFYNEIAGGSAGGHRYLLGSNIDWGQDLLFLRDYLARTGIRPTIVATDLSLPLDSLGLSRFAEEISEDDFLAGAYTRQMTVVPITTLCRPEIRSWPTTAQRIPSSFSLYQIQAVPRTTMNSID